MIKFFSFIKNPFYTESFEKVKWFDVFSLLFIFYIIEFPLGIFTRFLISILNLEQKPIPLPYLEKIIYGLLLAPILEELIMRLLLVFTKRNLVLFLSINIMLLLVFFFRDNNIKFFLFLFLILLFSVILINYNPCRLYFIKYFKSFFYFIAILFGLIHIFNFNGITILNFIWTPLIIIPQIIMGFLFGYIRVTYGFIYAVICHALINLPIIFTFMK
jgi:hypothetical protein